MRPASASIADRWAGLHSELLIIAASMSCATCSTPAHLKRDCNVWIIRLSPELAPQIGLDGKRPCSYTSKTRDVPNPLASSRIDHVGIRVPEFDPEVA